MNSFGSTYLINDYELLLIKPFLMEVERTGADDDGRPGIKVLILATEEIFASCDKDITKLN